jgi:hypothetical protein
VTNRQWDQFGPTFAIHSVVQKDTGGAFAIPRTGPLTTGTHWAGVVKESFDLAKQAASYRSHQRRSCLKVLTISTLMSKSI